MQSVLRKYQPQRVPKELHADVISAAAGLRLSDRTEADARSLLAAQADADGNRSFYPRDLAAGALLAYVLASGSAGERRSIERAIEVFKREARSIGGVEGGRSRRAVLQTWSDFMPVAHLCAARLLLGPLWEARGGGNGAILARWLAFAEAIR